MPRKDDLSAAEELAEATEAPLLALPELGEGVDDPTQQEPEKPKTRREQAEERLRADREAADRTRAEQDERIRAADERSQQLAEKLARLEGMLSARPAVDKPKEPSAQELFELADAALDGEKPDYARYRKLNTDATRQLVREEAETVRRSAPRSAPQIPLALQTEISANLTRHPKLAERPDWVERVQAHDKVLAFDEPDSPKRRARAFERAEREITGPSPAKFNRKNQGLLEGEGHRSSTASTEDDGEGQLSSLEENVMKKFKMTPEEYKRYR